MTTPLLKWIRCAVKPQSRADFDRAQRGWSVLADDPGLRFQIGGWDERHPDEAAILALWESRECYAEFMATRHDPIVERSRQGAQYTPVLTRLFDALFPMEGRTPDHDRAFCDAEIVRVAHCRLRSDREAHFLEVQLGHWAPGMRSAGMSAGLVGVSRHEQGVDYLVCSAWRTKLDHSSNVKRHFPKLRESAAVENDVETLAGSVVVSERDWIVKGLRQP